MALFRKLFYRKPPDGLLEISERVYVFDSCFTTDVWDEKNYKGYVGNVINELREQFVEPAILVFNFRDAEWHSRMANALSEYDMTIMDYPRHYESCPLLPMEVIHHFLRSSESWLSLGQNNLLIMHCERGGWPVLAFMLAALLLYRRQYSGEQKTLDMVYKQAPRELLHLLAPLNPVPSQLRYLQYISRRNLVPQWPPLDRALSMDCVIIRMIPNVDGGGCRPVFRIYGPDPALVGDRTPKVLYSTPKRSKAVRHYKQAECELVKIDINCNIQGDVVLECISLNDDLEREKMVFRAMFNTAFIRSNILMLNRDDIDIFWDGKDQFPKDFRAEILFSEMDAAASMVPMDMSCFADKEGLPEEAFAKVNEIFNSVDWLVPNAEAALNAIQQVAAANVAREMFGTHATEINALAQAAANDKIQEKLSPLALEGIGKVSSHIAFNELSSPASSPFVNDSEAGKQVPTLVSPAEPPLKDALIGSNKPTPPSSAAPPPPPPPVIEKLASRIKQQAPPPPPPPPPKVQGSDSESSSHVEKYTAKPLSPASPLQTLYAPATPKREDKSKRVDLSPASAPSPPVTEKTASSTPPPPPPPPPKRLSYESSSANYAMADTVAPLSNAFPSQSLLSPGTPVLEDKDKRSASSLTELPNIASTLTKSATQKMVPSPPPPPPLPFTSSLPVNEGPRTGSVLPPPCLPPPSSQAGRASTVPSIPPSLPPPPLHPTLRPSAPSLVESSSPPPPPPPPPPTSRESSIITSEAPQPPPPPPPLSPMKQSAASKGGPPPPPPPPLTPMKQSAASKGGPPPPPPPPMHSGATRGPSNSSVAPPPPPPPMVHSSSVPSAPPPPTPPKGDMRSLSAVGGKVAPSPPPPSAPMPGAKGKSTLSRTLNSKNSQTKKLKPLHWLKLTRAVQGSLWAEAQKSGEAAKAPDIDISELETLFSAAVPTSDQGSGSKGASRGSLNKKPEKVQLIDHRRAYNCEIMLSKVKIPLPDLLSSVLALEDSAMDVDQVENLIKFCPTKEEMELLKGYKGERDKLGKCEQFFLEMMQVPRIEQKLRVFSFKIQFHTQVSELQKNLNNVNSAADQIRNSAKLKRIMQTILSLGNALNQGTARGSAVGFRLDSLLKLTETRARNNKMTLMHYLCKVLVDKLPELLDFSKELSSLEAASKIQLKFLAEEMQAVNKGLEKVVQELSMAKNDGPVSEQFCKALTEFLSYAEGEVRHLALSYSGVGRNVDALILYFGEDPSRCPFEQVMSTILNFVRMFNQAHEENCKQIEFEKKKAEKEAAAAGKLKLKPSGNETESIISSPIKG